jgi:aryl-alcohol dehydrogenase-like predicted oxidoreductase
MSMSQMAQRWILDHEEVSVVIPGATSAAQARENSSVSELPALSRELHDRLRRFYEDEVAPFIRGPY